MAGKQPPNPPPPPMSMPAWALRNLHGKGYVFNGEREQCLREAWRELDEIESRVGLPPTSPREIYVPPKPSRPDPGVREARFLYDGAVRDVITIFTALVMFIIGLAIGNVTILMCSAAMFGLPIVLQADSGTTDDGGPR